MLEGHDVANDCINLVRIEAEKSEVDGVCDSLRAVSFDFGGRTWLGGEWQRAARSRELPTLADTVIRFLNSAHAGYPRLGAGDGVLELRFESRWDPPIRVVTALARREPGRTISLLYAEQLEGFAGLVSLRGGTEVACWRTDDLAEGDHRLLELGFDWDATYREALDLEWEWMRSRPRWSPRMRRCASRCARLPSRRFALCAPDTWPGEVA